MNTNRQRGLLLRSTVVGMAAASTLVLGACGDTAGPETGASVDSVQEDPGIAGDPVGDVGDPVGDVGAEPGGEGGLVDVSEAPSYVGQQVTVSAEVNEILSPQAFTIAGTIGTTVDELLVVRAAGGAPVTAESTVQVTGTVRSGFDVVAAEGFVGTDLDDGLFTDFTGENYIEATAVDLTVPEEPT